MLLCCRLPFFLFSHLMLTATATFFFLFLLLISTAYHISVPLLSVWCLLVTATKKLKAGKQNCQAQKVFNFQLNKSQYESPHRTQGLFWGERTSSRRMRLPGDQPPENQSVNPERFKSHTWLSTFWLIKIKQNEKFSSSLVLVLLLPYWTGQNIRSLQQDLLESAVLTYLSESKKTVCCISG